MTKNVCLMGASLETGNMGVSALAVSLVKNIIDINPEASISILIGNRTAKKFNLEINGKLIPIYLINYRLSPKAKVLEHLFCIFLLAVLQRIMPFKVIRNRIIHASPWLKALQEADFIGDIHGGDSFSDIYGLTRFFIEVLPDFIVFLMKKNLVLLPETYGPYNHPISNFFAQQILQRSFLIYARDNESTSFVNKMLDNQVAKHRVHFCPDVAFTLHAIQVEKPDIRPPIDANLGLPLIGLNVNGLMYNGGYTRENMFGLKFNYNIFIKNLVIRLLAETNAHILFTPHTFGPVGNINSDPDACSDVYKSITNKNRLHLVRKVYNQSELKNIIGHCDFFIGSRMHACIAALSQTIPTIGVAYSKKFVGVFESIGVKDMSIDARNTDTKDAIDKILLFFVKRTEIKLTLANNINPVLSKIRKTFQGML